MIGQSKSVEDLFTEKREFLSAQKHLPNYRNTQIVENAT